MPLPRHLLGEALLNLEKLEKYVYGLVERFFPRDERRMKEFLRKRFEGAREVLLHANERIVGVRRLAPNAYIISIVSSRYTGRPVALEPRAYKKLTGGVSLVHPREAIEAVYYVEIGPYALKCTCPDAVYTAARADKMLMEAGFPPQAYKYTLCKHILAGLATLWAMNLLDPTKPPIDEAILRALVTIYLATLPPGRKPKISRIALVYSRTGDQSPVATN